MSNTKCSVLYFSRLLLVPVLGLGVAVCGPSGGQRTAGTTSDTTGMAGGAVPPAAEAPGMVPPGGMAPALSAPQITEILSSSDSAEILPSKLAVDKAQNPAVKAYAQRMIKDHGMLEDSLHAMAKRQNISPAPSPLSNQLHSQTQTTMQRLQGLSGAEFDQAYMQAMVQSHQEALNMIDNQLLPATQDPQLQMALSQKVRPIVSSHLQEAQQIQRSLTMSGQATR